MTAFNRLIKTLRSIQSRISGPHTDVATLNAAIRAYKQQEFTIARQLLEPFADTGYLRAQQCMAMMCLNGLGGPADIEQAKKWFELAANQGDKASRARLKRLI